MSLPNIAVLLAAYKGESWIEKQVNSITSQREVNIHIYISIDTSSDATYAICMRLAKLGNIFILKNAGRFGDAAKNFFRLIRDVDFSEYDYISYADQDDLWHPFKLERAINILASERCDGYSSNVTAFWNDGNSRLIDKAQPLVHWDYLFESAGPGCTYVLSKNLALELQAFIRDHLVEMHSVWLHDWFTYAFARAQGFRWTIDSQPTMQYRQHSHNQVGVNSGFKAFKYRAGFVLSGKGMIQSALVAKLVGQAQSDFVRSWFPFSRSGFLKLALKANLCRRKHSERILFFFACLLLAVIGMSTSDNRIDAN